MNSAFDALATQNTTLVHLDDEIAASKNPSEWAGAAADAAAANRVKLVAELAGVVAELNAVKSAVDATAEVLTGIEHAVKEADTLARNHGFIIDDSGTLDDVLTPPEVPGPDRVLIQAELEDRIAQTMRAARDLDNDLSAILRKAINDQIDDSDAHDLTTAAMAGHSHGASALSVVKWPAFGDVTASAAWWDTLSDNQKAWVLRHHPGQLGNRDGIPAAIRDQANRARLPTERIRLEARLNELERQLNNNVIDSEWLGGLTSNHDEELTHIKEKLASLDKIEKMLAEFDAHAKNGEGALAQLLLLDMESGQHAQAAIGQGDVDNADHVAVYTPGLNSTVGDDMARDLNKMNNLRITTESLTPGSIATITWFGYDAPELHEFSLDPTLSGDKQRMEVYKDLLDSNSVLSDHAAETGAKNLNDFLVGIDASRDNDPHLTAIGHSYGSLTTGLALQTPTGVDDAVFFGSPGIGTNEAGDLRVPEDHAFVLEARGDFVADTGKFSGDPSGMSGLQPLTTEEMLRSGEKPLGAVTGHSSYLENGSASQHNIAAVIAERPDLAYTLPMPDPPRSQAPPPGVSPIPPPPTTIPTPSAPPAGPAQPLPLPTR